MPHRATILPLYKRLTLILGAWLFIGTTHSALADTKSASSVPAANLIQPAELAAILQAPASPKLVVLQVGFRTLYDQAHIPGADYAGPANTPAGLQALRDRVAPLPKDTSIVIYCGCCPWTRCPTIAAAYETLHEMGFTKVRAMHVAENFGVDWVDKGYPTLKSN